MSLKFKIMTIGIKGQQNQEVKSITILTLDADFTISLNKFNELVINKNVYSGESAIVIKPSVSNEIRIL